MECDAHMGTDIAELAGESPVLIGGREGTRWVVVHQDQCRGIAVHGCPEHLAGVHVSGITGPFAKDPGMDDPACCIEADEHELLS